MSIAANVPVQWKRIAEYECTTTSPGYRCTRPVNDGCTTSLVLALSTLVVRFYLPHHQTINCIQVTMSAQKLTYQQVLTSTSCTHEQDLKNAKISKAPKYSQMSTFSQSCCKVALNHRKELARGSALWVIKSLPSFNTFFSSNQSLIWRHWSSIWTSSGNHCNTSWSMLWQRWHLQC